MGAEPFGLQDGSLEYVNLSRKGRTGLLFRLYLFLPLLPLERERFLCWRSSDVVDNVTNMRLGECDLLLFFGLDRLANSSTGISKNNPLLYIRATAEGGTYASANRNAR